MGRNICIKGVYEFGMGNVLGASMGDNVIYVKIVMVQVFAFMINSRLRVENVMVRLFVSMIDGSQHVKTVMVQVFAFMID